MQRGEEEPVKQEISNIELIGNKLIFDATSQFRNASFQTTYAAIIDGGKMRGWSMSQFGGSQRDTRWECDRE